LDDAVEDTNSKSPFSLTNTYLDVRAALKELPADLREVVELRYGQDLAIKDVAQVLGISRFAVRRKINAALAQLEELLGPVYGKSIRRTAQNNKETMHL
jgi:RNA polymerase sigma-70 factor (ECF subfamily)